MRDRISLFIVLALLIMPMHDRPANAQTAPNQPTLDAIVKSNRDLITDYALARPEGPTYENIAPLLPPVRWVTAQFRHFPVLLSAPSALVKGRIVSNGSVLNPLANFPPTWKEAGRELQVFIGNDQEPFGQSLERQSPGTWLDGWKPVWTVPYLSKTGDSFKLAVFAAVEPELAAQGALWFQLQLISDKPAAVAIRLAESTNQSRLVATQNIQSKPKTALPELKSADWLKLGPGWQADPLDPLKWSATLAPGQRAEGLLLTKPIDAINNYQFETSRAACVQAWERLIQAGPGWFFPEPLIENAWKAHLVALHMIIAGSKPNYSALNAYDHLYMTEGSDLLRGLAYWGQFDKVRNVIDAQLAFQRKDTQTAVAGLKLTLTRDLIDLLNDPGILNAQEPRWMQARDFITKNLDPKHGLPPADRFAGDISGAVFNLRSSALCWLGLNDLSLALKHQGRVAEAAELSAVALKLHRNIIKALEESESLDHDPEFVPIGFFGKDSSVQRIPDTQASSYYNLVLGNVIDSGILDQDRESRVFRYLENRAGLSMGMPRTRPFWKNSPYYGQDGIAPLYGLKYAEARLRRNQPDHAIAMLYGWLAHGMTRESFIHGEGVRYTGGDSQGRYFHLPPNSTSAANWLSLLRMLILQELDLNHDFEYETLRLLDATPRAWLADGRELAMTNAPSRFGPVSLKLKSEIARGEMQLHLSLPFKKPGLTTIQFRLPAPYKAVRMESGTRTIMPTPDHRFDLSGVTAADTHWKVITSHE